MRLLNGTDVNRQISVRLKILSRRCHPHSQNQKSMNIIMTTQIVSGIVQKHGIGAL